MTASPDAAVTALRPPRTSLIAAPGSATIDATVVEDQVARDLLRRLVGESMRAEIAHLVLIAVVAVLLWPWVAHITLAVWAAVVTTCTATRAALRLRVRRGDYPATGRALGRIRLILAASGLSWGIGAAVVMADAPVSAAALLLVVLCGLAAGGVVSLSGDLWAFRYFLAGLLVPVPIGIVQGAFQRETAIAIFLIVFYAAAMIVFQRASYQLLHDHLQQSFDLVGREHQAVQDRAYLDAVLASAPVAIAVLGGDGRVRGVNPQFESLFGFTAQEAVGRDLNELIVPRSELPKAARFDGLARRGERVSVEVERRRKDGSLIPVMASASQVAGSAAGDVFVMYEDISDRRKAQDAISQLANIVQSSEDAIVGQTLDGAVVTWNAAAERMFGYAFAEIKGRNIGRLRPPELATEADEILERIKRGERVDHFETVRLRKDGTRFPVSLTISLTRDPRGRISGFSTIARDVSSDVASRRALSDARDAAQRLAQTRSSFLANMSHEIRTPMNAILGLTELLLDTELAPEQRHSLTLVQTSAETLLTLLNDILDLSKIEAEHLELESIPFDLEHLIESTVELLAIRARERRLNLLADVAADLPTNVRGDPTRLRQILTNLISNAIKFTHEGEVVVAASRSSAPDGQSLVRFAVRDTGIGIAAEKLNAIFEEFSQADTSTTRKYGGTGLGLAICRRLVRLMGGELAVTSQVDQGTEFSFAVPLDSAAPAQAAPAVATPLAGRRVLVVDDNPTNRRVVLNMLAAVDMEVTEAASGATGLAVLRRAQRDEAPFDLAIIDSEMPEMDGFALAQAVRADPGVGRIPLVMLTSSGRPGDGQRCRDLGIDGYLPKPASRSDLLEALKTVLAGTSVATTGDIVTRHSIAESRRHLHILVAEDNPVNQEVVAAMLRKRGHTIDVVANGRLAVDAVAQTRYDVVLMDIQMPEMDGFAATHAIRDTPAGKDLPIIALTAHALSGERERCLSHGMTDYLTKPLRAHELFAVVEGWAPSAGDRGEPAVPQVVAAAVDVEGFREQMRLAGAEGAVDQILDTFLESTPQRVHAIMTALAAGNAGDIERAAHALKSAAGTIGAKSLAALLQQIEAAGKAGDVPAARALQDRLEGESAAVIEQLTRPRGTSSARS